MKHSNRFGLTMLVVLATASFAAVQVAPADQEPSEPAPAIAQGASPAPVPRAQTDNMVTDSMVPLADDLGVEPVEMTIYPEQLLGDASGEPGMSVLARAQVITPGALATTLLNEGFESTWPAGPWSVWFFGGNQSNATWGRTSYRKSSGSYSIWCAGGGSGAAAPGGSVPLNTSGGTIVGPFDLTNATSGSFAFDLWLQTELNVDQFKWMAESGCDPSVSACTFSGLQTSTNTSGFQRKTQNLADWGSAGSLLGKSNVWIALIYTSNGSNQFEGAYVDNVALTFDTGGGSQCGTYVVSADNDNNAWAGSADGDWSYCLFKTDAKHPIEFHVDVTETSITTAQLLLLCNDVDEDSIPNQPEVDKVYVNDTYVGNLTGANDEDSTTLLTVPASVLHSGRNKVRIDVNTDTRSAADQWCVTLKQAQLIVNGGCQGTATCRSVTTNKTSYDPGNTVVVTYEVDTTAASQQVRVESNLVAPDGTIVAGTERTYTTSGSQNDPQAVNLTLPTGAGGGTYRAKILIFDKLSGRLEKTCEASFVVTGGGSPCGTYVLTEDNDNNAWAGSADGDWKYCLFKTDAKHPIEFHIDVTETSFTTAQLLLLCNDVDEDSIPNQPEVDKVYVNDSYVGALTGANDQDSTTFLTVPVNVLRSGRNKVRIDVNTDTRSAADQWCVTLKQAQLIVNGGCQGSATCRSVTTDKSSYAAGATVKVTYEVDTTLVSQQVRVESNLVAPDGTIVAGSEKTYTTSGSQNDPQTVSLSLPAQAAAGTYKAKIFIFDTATGRLEKSCEASFVVTGCSIACTATVPTTGLVGQAISFVSTSTPTNCAGAADYFWTFGDGTTAVAQAQNTTYTYTKAGTYTWTLTVVIGNARCEKTGTITITQGGGTTCTLGCSAVVPTTALVGQTITFQGASTTSNCTGTPSYFWTFGDGTTAVAQAQNTTYSYSAPGTYTWELIVVLGTTRCVRTGTITVTRTSGGACVLGCDATVPTSGTVGTPVTFQGSATATGCTGTPEYFWTFGDGTTAVAQGKTVTATYDAPGTYTWELSVVVNGVLCVRRGTITITGGSGTGCRVGCSAVVPATALVNQQVQFLGSASTVGCTGPAEYFWFFGDGTTAVAQAQNTTWSYSRPGVYTWEFMVVVNGVWCRRSGTITVVSGAGCGLNCAAAVPATAQVGQTVSFRGFVSWSNCTTAPAYLWDFGDMTMPAGGSSPSHVYQAPGTYEWQMTTMVDGVYCVRNGVIIITSASQPANCRYSQWFQVGSQATGVGANWRTDVSILNPTQSTAQLQLRLHTSAGVKTLNKSLGPFRHTTVANVVGQMAFTGSGGLQLCSDQPVRANSRTYNQASATNTYGQYYGPYTTTQAVTAGELAWLVGLRQDAAFRTNIAVTNTGTTTAIVAVSLYNGDGTRLAGYTVSLAPGEWEQQNKVFQTYAGRTDISSGFARVAVLSGTGVIVSASVIDNATNDAVTNPWLF
ncbi:MAG: PKD domain-containing protein [Thermoanaerobaculaceae bacterium]|jgi:PKD repeat protein|nr:PKD domain-containing protein [Thermoanaerobaculaceae bacterium]